MIDINTFLMMVICILGSILLVFSIILVVKLIHTVDRLNGMIDEVSNKMIKFDKMFRIVDIVTDNMAMISDKIVDGISNCIRKIFYRKNNGKEEDINE